MGLWPDTQLAVTDEENTRCADSGCLHIPALPQPLGSRAWPGRADYWSPSCLSTLGANDDPEIIAGIRKTNMSIRDEAAARGLFVSYIYTAVSLLFHKERRALRRLRPAVQRGDADT
jgi:hypothetical protein